MAAAKTMVLARFGFALNCVAVGHFAFCHGCEETILAFGIVFSSQLSNTVSMGDAKGWRRGGWRKQCIWKKAVGIFLVFDSCLFAKFAAISF
jgi:hypothetical protein